MYKVILGFTSFVFTIGASAAPTIAQVSTPTPIPTQQVAQTVSPQELERFAAVWLTVRNINIISLELFARLLRSEGISRDRAAEIVETGLGNTEILNAQEQQIVETIQPLVRAVARFRQVTIEREIQEAGYTLERYDEIAQAIEADNTLQQQFQQVVEQLLQSQQ